MVSIRHCYVAFYADESGDFWKTHCLRNIEENGFVKKLIKKTQFYYYERKNNHKTSLKRRQQDLHKRKP